MFEDERRSATVEAIEPTSVVGVLGPDMRRLMTEHPEIATRLVIALGRRLRETNERLSRQSFQTVQSRVAVVLSELVEQEIAEERDQMQADGARRASPRRGTGDGPRPRPARGDVLSPPPRPTSRSSRAPRASRPAASSPCSSAPA